MGNVVVDSNSIIFINLDREKFVLGDGDFQKVFNLADVYFGGELFLNEVFENGDDKYSLYFRISSDDLFFDYLIKKNDVAVFPALNVKEFYTSFSKYPIFSNRDILQNLSDVNGFVNSLSSDFNDLQNQVDNYYNTLHSDIDNINVDLTPVTDKLNEIDGKFDNINVDLSPVTKKLNEIDKRFDILKVLNISQTIDEKLSQLFAMKSLNGSNGSKFKDGASVTVKGYDGNWVVEGSYPMLNADNVTIIVYKLKQNDMVLLAPAPFVAKV